MAQKNWQIHGAWGRNHIIGLYHGQDSGHVVVHCNNKVILLDFNVLDTKTYSFFVDQELCELVIKPQADTYDYELNINYQADTPQNRTRKDHEKKDRKAFILSLIIGALIFLGAFLLAYFLVNLEK